KLREEVRDMRERLRAQDQRAKRGFFDLKQGPGGIVDIEFLVQYLLLLESHRRPGLMDWTDNIRQLQSLIEAGVMDNPTADFLKHAYLITRAYAHMLSLQDKPAMVPVTTFPKFQEKVMRIWKYYMGTDKG
ncbi:MAG: hypothetical protein GY859_33090, partial [Desulfobacterales bacterium]|nr:hypothetical protein [Desulfobacterales bacterium]